MQKSSDYQHVNRIAEKFPNVRLKKIEGIDFVLSNMKDYRAILKEKGFILLKYEFFEDLKRIGTYSMNL